VTLPLQIVFRTEGHIVFLNCILEFNHAAGACEKYSVEDCCRRNLIRKGEFKEHKEKMQDSNQSKMNKCDAPDIRNHCVKVCMLV